MRRNKSEVYVVPVHLVRLNTRLDDIYLSLVTSAQADYVIKQQNHRETQENKKDEDI